MAHRGVSVWMVGAALAAGATLAGQSAPKPQPSKPSPPQAAASASAGFDLTRLSRIDTLVNEAIADKKLPGAVVVVGRGDSIVYRKAYGLRATAPSEEAMTADTIFDMASLTKVMATTPAVMMLVEEGKVRLTDPVA